MRSKLRMADLQKRLPSVFMSLKATAAGEEIITGQNVIAEKEEK